MSSRRYLSITLLAATLLTGVGCSSDDDDNGSANNGNNGEQPPLYLASSITFTPNGTVTYVHVLDSMDDSTVFDEAKALEISGSGLMDAPQDNPARAFYVAAGADPVIQRYLVSEQGEITLDNELSMAAHGVTRGASGPRPLHLVSDTIGYHVDADTLQVIVFHPTDMTITDVIPLTGLLYEDDVIPRLALPFLDQGRLIMPASYWSDATNRTPTNRGSLAILDIASGSVSYDTQTQCGDISWSAADAEGNIYFASHVDLAINQAAGVIDTAPCMVRMKAGENTFDSDYYVNLFDLTNDNRPVTALAPSSGDTAYTLIYASDAAPVTPENARDLSGSVWEFHSIELGNEVATVTKVADAPLTSPFPFISAFEHDTLGDITYLLNINADFSESTLYNINAPDNWTVITKAPGYLNRLIRMQ